MAESGMVFFERLQSVVTLTTKAVYLATICGFLYLVTYSPSSIKKTAQELGLKKAETPFGTYEFAQETSQALITITNLLENAIETTNKLNSKKENQSQQISNIVNDLTKAKETVSKTDTLITNKISQIQTSQPEPSVTGWIYLGRTDDTKQNWSKVQGANHYIKENSPPKEPGKQITISTPVYLRAEKGSNTFHYQADIIDALREGTTASILELDPVKATGEGYQLWAKVTAKAP